MSMESTFCGITISSASKQLKSEISVFLKDVLFAVATLKEYGLCSLLRSMFNYDCSFQLQSLDLNCNGRDNDTILLNICHLFGLMVTFGINLKLTRCGQLQLPKDGACGDDDHRYRQLNLLKLFDEHCEKHRHKHQHECIHLSPRVRQHIERARHQEPIVLCYGDDDDDHLCNRNSELVIQQNAKLWAHCKQRHATIDLDTDCKHNKSRGHGIKNDANKSYLRLPKKVLPPYHDKNYHMYGRQRHLPTYSMQHVATHNTADSCWIVVRGLVLDVTSFLPYHPASHQCILKNAGKVCDMHFKMHSKNAQQLFWKFVIGKIEKENECIIQ
mmetsp:Transcript_31105/g.50460  ORF Transcript_31105/g.50460 Transcript_31105/m.50460 type:complete len:328 (+) Transcript_31105:35-1018(+)